MEQKRIEINHDALAETVKNLIENSCSNISDQIAAATGVGNEAFYQSSLQTTVAGIAALVLKAITKDRENLLEKFIDRHLDLVKKMIENSMYYTDIQH